MILKLFAERETERGKKTKINVMQTNFMLIID